MLIIEVWNGSRWRVAAKVKPGVTHAMLDYRSRDDTDVLRFAVEPEQTTITIDGSTTVIELRARSEPWERMLHAKWMRAPMMCRLHHRSEPLRSVGYGRNGQPRAARP
jgi:hypothetical protein